MTTQPPCKVIRIAQQTQVDVSRLTSSMRRLRAALNQCETCPEQNCPLIMEITAAISSAIAELTEEWSL